MWEKWELQSSSFIFYQLDCSIPFEFQFWPSVYFGAIFVQPCCVPGVYFSAQVNRAVLLDSQQKQLMPCLPAEWLSLCSLHCIYFGWANPPVQYKATGSSRLLELHRCSKNLERSLGDKFLPFSNVR